MRERSGLDWLKTILSIPPELGLEERESALWGEEGDGGGGRGRWVEGGGGCGGGKAQREANQTLKETKG